MRPPAVKFIDSHTGTTLSAGVTSVTFTATHAVGDLLIATGGGRQEADPTFTAGWTKIASYFSPSSSKRVGIIVYKFATSTADATVTFTSSGTSSDNYSGGQVFRNVSAIGNSAVRTNISGLADTSVPLPAMSLTQNNGTSAIYASTYIPYITSVPDMSIGDGQAYWEQVGPDFTARTATISLDVSNISGVVELLN